MEHYDIVIVGGGIAGCGLAYNLSQVCPKKDVLLIDKINIKKDNKNTYRNTFYETIKKYKLPHIHVFDGIKLRKKGEKGTITIKEKFYCVDYREACKHLFDLSNTIFKKEIALCVKNKSLITNKNGYKFDYLIDCSGSNFFLKKILKHPLPFMYWVGNVKVFEKSLKNNNDNYFYFLSDKSGSIVEDFYVLPNNKIVQGDWKITNKINFDLIKPLNNSLYKKHHLTKAELIKKENVAYPCSPAIPLVYKNYAFLGDSFGNATPIAGEGIRNILKSSEILTQAIKKKNLKLYEKNWKKRYFDLYIRYLAQRFDLKNKHTIARLLRKDNKTLVSLLKNQKIYLPKSIKKRISKKIILKQLYYYTYLRLKYFLMQLV